MRIDVFDKGEMVFSTSEKYFLKKNDDQYNTFEDILKRSDFIDLRKDQTVILMKMPHNDGDVLYLVEPYNAYAEKPTDATSFRISARKWALVTFQGKLKDFFRVSVRKPDASWKLLLSKFEIEEDIVIFEFVADHQKKDSGLVKYWIPIREKQINS